MELSVPSQVEAIPGQLAGPTRQVQACPTAILIQSWFFVWISIWRKSPKFCLLSSLTTKIECEKCIVSGLSIRFLNKADVAPLLLMVCAALTIKMCKILEKLVSAALQCTSTSSSILYTLPHAFFEATLYTHCCVWIRIRGADAHVQSRLRSTVKLRIRAPARATITTTNSTTRNDRDTQQQW